MRDSSFVANNAEAETLPNKKEYPKPASGLSRYIAFRLIHPAQFIWPGSSRIFKDIRNYQARKSDLDQQLMRFDINDASNICTVQRINNYDENKHVGVEPNHRCFYATTLRAKDNPPEKDVDAVHVIYVSSNADCYELNIDEMEHEAKNGAVVIGFNPMGVGLSPGHSRGPEDIEACLETVIDALLAKGVPCKNIVLKGRSLGAAIATKVAAKDEYQKPGDGVTVINDRSFKKMSDAVGCFIKANVPIFKQAIHDFFAGLVKALGLEIDALAAFKSINEKNSGNAIAVVLNAPDSVLLDSAIRKEDVIEKNLENNQHYIECDATSSINNHNANRNDLVIIDTKQAGKSKTVTDYFNDFLHKHSTVKPEKIPMENEVNNFSNSGLFYSKQNPLKNIDFGLLDKKIDLIGRLNVLQEKCSNIEVTNDVKPALLEQVKKLTESVDAANKNSDISTYELQIKALEARIASFPTSKKISPL